MEDLRLIMAASAAAAFLVAAPLSAAVTDFECALKERGDSGWISDTLILQHDVASGKVTVVDTVILSVNAKPVSGRVVKTSGNQLTYQWEIKSPRDRNGQIAPSMVYQMMVDRTSGAATLQARPTGFDETFVGKGKCKITGG